MIKYPKINTLWKRDMGRKGRPVIEGQFACPFVASVANTDWVWSEKIDGMNIRIGVEDDLVMFAGRTDKAQLPPALIAHLRTVFPSAQSLMQAIEIDHTNFTLFGEGCGRKIQKWGLERYGEPKFVLFDVNVSGVWLPREQMVAIATRLNLPFAKMLGVLTVYEAWEHLKQIRFRTEEWNTELLPEGVVGVPAAGLLDRWGRRLQTKMKYVDIGVHPDSAKGTAGA